MASAQPVESEIECLGSEYRTGASDLLRDFFQPCLSRCIRYDRAAGFFRSSALVAWAGALSRIALGDEIKIRLLISPELGEKDREAMVAATNPAARKQLRSEAADRFLLDVIKAGAEGMTDDVRLRLMAWLIANDHLEIRFAFPAHIEDPGAYHEKLGIFEFASGNRLAFSGSANESISGHRRNWESIDVFRDWYASERKRVDAKQHQFDESWYGQTEGLETVPLSVEALSRIQTVAPAEKPLTVSVQSADAKYELFEHQAAALAAWEANDRNGLLEMCTGSGKTITAIEAIHRLAREPSPDPTRGTLAVIACPTKVLVDQWDSEVRKWRPDWRRLKAYDDIAQYAANLSAWLMHPGEDNYVLITTYTTLLSPPFLSQIKRVKSRLGQAMFVADEAHHLGSANALTQVEPILSAFTSRLALTATPEIEAAPERTQRLLSLFEGSVFTFALKDAVEKGILCPYNYYPRPVFLDAEMSVQYLQILGKIESSSDRQSLDLYRQKRELLRRSGVYLTELEHLVDELSDGGMMPHDLTVVFSPPGRGDNDQRIIYQVKKVFSDRHASVASITAKTPQQDRQKLIEECKQKKFNVLLGIGCLDEGFDIPEAKRAIILYSVDRQKQFIQRRGRILRRADGKTSADIYDLIMLPHGAELDEAVTSRIFEKELRRYREFASAALNPEQASQVLDDALRSAGGSREDV